MDVSRSKRGHRGFCRGGLFLEQEKANHKRRKVKGGKRKLASLLL